MPLVTQFGFATAAGLIQNIADRNEATFWKPLPTGLDTITDQFFTPDGTALNYGGSFAALQWDFGSDIRVTSFMIKVETHLSLGPAVLIGSANPASSVANTLQVGDVLLATYSADQIVSNNVLPVPVSKAADLRFRYYRLLQRTSDPVNAPPVAGAGVYGSYEGSSGLFETPSYSSLFIMEGWGGGASGGLTGNAVNGGDTTISRESAFILTAGGGVKATASAANSGTGAGTGGAASGANTLNVAGGDAGVPSPASSGEGLSGKGGDAPNGGGVGGPSQTNSGYMIRYGNDGQSPGGGGSGRNISTSIAGGTYFKFPGGGSGGYFKHVLRRGIDAAAPAPGDMIAWTVGAGGLSPSGDGHGANGRARFSWT